MKKDLTANEVDELVTSLADEDDAWDKPISVNRIKKISLNLQQSPEIVSEKRYFRRNALFSRDSCAGFGFAREFAKGRVFRRISRKLPYC